MKNMLTKSLAALLGASMAMSLVSVSAFADGGTANPVYYGTDMTYQTSNKPVYAVVEGDTLTLTDTIPDGTTLSATYTGGLNGLTTSLGMTGENTATNTTITKLIVKPDQNKNLALLSSPNLDYTLYLKNADLSGGIVTVTNLRSYLGHCSSLEAVKLYSVSGEVNARNLLNGDVKLTDFPEVTGDWKVNNMRGMLSNCANLKNVTIPANFQPTANVDMGYTFNACTNLEKLDLSNMNFSGIQNASFAFGDCSKLGELILPTDLSLDSLTSLSWTFKNCTSLDQATIQKFISAIPKGQHIEKATGTFSGCDNLKSIDLSNLDLSEAAGETIDDKENTILSGATLETVILPEKAQNTGTYTMEIPDSVKVVAGSKEVLAAVADELPATTTTVETTSASLDGDTLTIPAGSEVTLPDGSTVTSNDAMTSTEGDLNIPAGSTLKDTSGSTSTIESELTVPVNTNGLATDNSFITAIDAKTYSSDMSEDSKGQATGFKASVTPKSGSTFNQMVWAVTSGNTTKYAAFDSTSVTLSGTASATFALIVDNLYDPSATATLTVQ